MNTDLSLLSLFWEASLLVKGVMIVLIIASITSWTVIFQRMSALSKARKSYINFEHYFRSGADLTRLYDYLIDRREEVSGIESVFKAGFREFMRLGKKEISVAPGVIHESVERAMRIALAREEQKLEIHLPFLATVGSISVYVGLFGTVWGIMTAFRALGTMQQATLAMVAPGISEALIATALGLFAAIPALCAYNRFSQHVQDLLRNCDNLAEEFSGLLYRHLYTKGTAHESSERAAC